MSLNPEFVLEIKRDWILASVGEKRQLVERWAEKLCCHPNTIYRHLDTGRVRKSPGRSIDNIEHYVEIVARIKKKPPESIGEISTEQAIRIAIGNGLIPEEMKGRTPTFDRIMRELGLNKTKRRIQRFQAEAPNQLHHIDASSSNFFYVHRKTEDGKDRVLRLHKSHKVYKNKPVNKNLRERPWIYGLVDDHSGFWVARYIYAKGESAIDNLDFIEWAWSQNDDTPFCGIPEKIKGDLGPMMRGPATKDFLERLSVEIDPSLPEIKESHGKIERPWRTAWQRFEKPFFAQSEWKDFEITLSDLNKQFLIYQKEYNSFPHRYNKSLSRLQAWKKINLLGGVVAYPEKAISTIARRYERTVGRDGCIYLKNHTYEVKDLHDAKVYIYEGVLINKLIVKDKATGKQHEIEDFVPNPIGKFTGHTETPHQKAVKAAKELEITNTLYSQPTDPGNVTEFPTRTKELREIDNPLSTNQFNSINEAMKEFTAICGFMIEPKNRQAVEALIIEHGLDRMFVADLALEVQSKTERSIDYG